jgi:uncharacterized protein YqgV (UPF0045/DUF77 family)
MLVSAQVSVYPLGPGGITPAVEAVWNTFESLGLSFSRGTMSTVVEGTSETVFAALQVAFESVADAGATVMVVTVSNACPSQVVESE